MKNRYVQRLNNLPINIDASKIPSLQGAEKIIKKLKTKLNPVIFIREMKIKDIKNNFITLSNLDSEEEIFKINSSYLTLGLKECSQVTFLAATLGETISEYSRLCFQEDKPWEGSVSDIFASHAIEVFLDNIYDFLQKKYLIKGLFPTLRFSPGYGDWALSEQEKILDLLNTTGLIKATEYHLLEPIKSVTALIGWSNRPQKKEYPQGNKGYSFCQGSGNCAFCNTWACMKK